MNMISGLSDVIDGYDTFILDQWGVMHNGEGAFEHAVQALQFLKANNKKVVILSNSGKTRTSSYGRLKDSGIDRDLYVDVLTSGDHMRANFKSGKFKSLGKNALFFAWDNDYSVLEECGLNDSNAQDASFVLCGGVDRLELSAYMDDLTIAYNRGLELVISNPDLVAMNGDGDLKICPGSIALAYQNMGGVVHWHGKPMGEIYTMCNDLVGGWDKAICVGDSLEHDVAGGNRAGIDSLFITTGIHAEKIHSQNKSTNNDTDAKCVIVSLCKQFNAYPTYSVKWFKV